MIWDELTRKAFEIACKAHAGQVDRGGVPYIFHPLHVADQMPNSTLGAVGLLHDVVEDTPVTFVDLLAAGIPEDVVAAVKLLTHTQDDGLSYLEYVARLKDDELAAPVKKADLRHNSSLSRLPHEPTEKDLSRQKRYRKALEILKDVPDYTQMQVFKGRSHSYGVRTTGQLQAPASLGGVVDDIIPNMAILLSKEEPLHGKFAVNLADYSKLWEAYLYPPAESTDSLNGISSAGYGRWIRRTTNGINYYNVCSKCGYETVLDTQSKYCPNCGFPMDLGMPDLAGKEEC